MTDFIINKQPSFWKEKLTNQEFNVLVKRGTDPAFHNKYDSHYEQGIYVCQACDQVLFSSEDKYKSGSGWPSFSNTIKPKAAVTRSDRKLAVERKEILCSRCGGHLGHVFEDGPQPTGLRYCINSSSMKFLKNAYLASGCFWGPDAYFGGLEGVYFTASGYMGGELEDPSYHNLGHHTETVRISYDPEIISFSELLKHFWKIHNPLSPTYSTQYKSLIFYTDQTQKDKARDFITKKKNHTDNEVFTEIKKGEIFYPAEDYHQHYQLRKNQNLNQYIKELTNLGEDKNYSRILTKMNAYSSGNLNQNLILQELKISYLKLIDEQLIDSITSNL